MDGRFSFIFLFLRPSPRCHHGCRSRRRKYLSRGSSDRVRKKRRRKERNGVQPERASEEITLAPVTSYIRILIYRPLSLSSWHGSNRGQHGDHTRATYPTCWPRGARGTRNLSQSRTAVFQAEDSCPRYEIHGTFAASSVQGSSSGDAIERRRHRYREIISSIVATGT